MLEHRAGALSLGPPPPCRRRLTWPIAKACAANAHKHMRLWSAVLQLRPLRSGRRYNRLQQHPVWGKGCHIALPGLSARRPASIFSNPPSPASCGFSHPMPAFYSPNISWETSLGCTEAAVKLGPFAGLVLLTSAIVRNPFQSQE